MWQYVSGTIDNLLNEITDCPKLDFNPKTLENELLNK